MDLSYLYNQQQLMDEQKARIESEHKGDHVFENLDEGRQKDVVDCLFAIRNSKKPEEVAAARRALKAIYDEYGNAKLRDARRWYMKQKEHGNYEDAKNFLEDVDKRPDVYNPYRTRSGR